MIKELLKCILKIFWLLPVKYNRIIFRSTHGTKYNCNPKYICEYLNDNCPQNIEIVWLFDKKEINNHIYLKDKGYKIANQKSILGIILLMTSRIIVDNHGLVSYVPIRHNQIVINTWHGGGSYKKEYGESTIEHKKYMQMMYSRTDYFISSCRKFSICNLEYLYKNSPDKILEIGMPRNDLFWKNDKNLKKQIKSRLGVDEKTKIVLYAPTFRYDANTDIYMLDPKRICAACEERFSGPFIFATRFHPFVEKRFLENKQENILITNWYEDMQELLLITDVLISDYSSCIWDASLAYLPTFIYASDLEYYSAKRNFHTPISEWPFPLAENEDDLIKCILNFDKDNYRKDVDAHHKALGSFENGDASKKVCDIIVHNMKR